MKTLDKPKIDQVKDPELEEFLRVKALREERSNTPERKRGLALARMVLAVSARVYKLLEEKGWTQRELARRMDVPESNVSRILEARHSLTLKTLAKLDVAFGESILMTHDEACEDKKVINVVMDKNLSRYMSVLPFSASRFAPNIYNNALLDNKNNMHFFRSGKESVHKNSEYSKVKISVNQPA